MKRATVLTPILWGVFLSLLVGLPFLLPSFFIVLASEVLIFALFAIAFNLVFGYAGLLSFGHAVYYGVGTYATGLLMVKAGAPLWAGLASAPMVGGLMALVLGYFCLRLTQIYFALLTLAFSQLMYSVAFKWLSLTGGDNGLIGVPIPSWLLPANNFYFFTLVLVVISVLIMKRVVDSPFGYTVRAIRDNPLRVRFIGVDVRMQQLIIFVISGFFSGLAGGIHVLYARSTSPESITLMKSAEPLLSSILGGLYTFWGPGVGAALMIGLNYLTSSFMEYWPVVMGSIIVLLVFFFQEGVIGTIQRKLKGK